MCRLTMVYLALSLAPLLAVSVSVGGRADNFLGASVAASDAEEELTERRFWVAQWHVLEGELLQLQHALAHEGELLQISATPAKATPVKNSTAKEEKPVKKEEKPAAKPAKEEKPAAKTVSASTAPKVPSAKLQVAAKHAKKVEMSVQDRLAKVKELTKGKMNKAMLRPMLAMLKGLYEDQKSRIGDLNKKEEQSKKRFATQKAAFDKRVQHIKDDVAQHKFSAEFGANQTRDYTMQFKYWEGVRSRDHKQFHNALKITHGLMAKEKDTIKQYEKALALKDPEEDSHSKFMNGILQTLAAHKKEDKAQKAVSEDVPEVVLLQFCREALAEVHHELGEVQQGLL